MESGGCIDQKKVHENFSRLLNAKEFKKTFQTDKVIFKNCNY